MERPVCCVKTKEEIISKRKDKTAGTNLIFKINSVSTKKNLQIKREKEDNKKSRSLK